MDALEIWRTRAAGLLQEAKALFGDVELIEIRLDMSACASPPEPFDECAAEPQDVRLWCRSGKVWWARPSQTIKAGVVTSDFNNSRRGRAVGEYATLYQADQEARLVGIPEELKAYLEHVRRAYQPAN